MTVWGSSLQIGCRLILLISEHPIQQGIRKECWHRIPGNGTEFLEKWRSLRKKVSLTPKKVKMRGPKKSLSPIPSGNGLFAKCISYMYPGAGKKFGQLVFGFTPWKRLFFFGGGHFSRNSVPFPGIRCQHSFLMPRCIGCSEINKIYRHLICSPSPHLQKKTPHENVCNFVTKKLRTFRLVSFESPRRGLHFIY